MAGVRLDDLLGGSFALVAPEARSIADPDLRAWWDSIGGRSVAAPEATETPVLVRPDRYIFAAGDDVDDLVTRLRCMLVSAGDDMVQDCRIAANPFQPQESR